MIIEGDELHHDNNPVFNWMMGNVVKKQSKFGPVKDNYYPSKESDLAKIDGPVALIMAVKRARTMEDDVITQGFVDLEALQA